MGQSVYFSAVALQAKGRLHEAVPLFRRVLPERRWRRGHHPGPDFLIIGAPRAGTTWLKKALSSHPQVRILAKEVHYFSMRFTEPPTAYLECFERGPYKGAFLDQPGPALFGEKSPSYLSMDRMKVALCAALFPDVRIVCMVREPVARAWSHMQLGGIGADRIGGHHYRKVIAHGRYSFFLRQWAAQFPAEQIHLVDFADIATDPGGVFDGVCRHIGAPVIAHGWGLAARRGTSFPADPPPEIRRVLEAAYEDEPYDLPTLRRVIAEHPRG